MYKKRGSINEQKKKAIQKGMLWPMVRKYALREMKPFLEEIRNEKYDEIHKIALSNYLIVRTVTIFEIFLLNEAHRIAKKDKKKTKKLFTDIKTNATLEDQVVSTYSFTKLENVNTVFSALLNIDFLEEIKKESIRYTPNYFYEFEHVRYTKPLHKNWDNVCKIFELRHEIIHHNKLVNLKYSELRNMIGGIMQFLMCSLMVTSQN